jgi:hypothetical protein
MKKHLFLAAVVLLTTHTFSATINVRNDGSGNYTTIAAASPNDIIDVLGTFTESGLIITKPLTIQGHGFANTIVQGNSTTPTSGNYSGLTRNSVFYLGDISAAPSTISVTLKNMTIKNGVSTSSTGRAGGITVGRIGDTGQVTAHP